VDGWKEFEAKAHAYESEPVIVWRLSGLLTNSKESYAFLEDLRSQLRPEPRSVILNVEKVDHITSAGVGIIAAAFTSATKAGAKLVLCALPKQVETVLSVVHLLSVVKPFATEEEALVGLRG
jgi:anti-anti-sigma factor